MAVLEDTRRAVRSGEWGRDEIGSIGASGGTLGSVLMTMVECEPWRFLRPCRISCRDVVDDAALDAVELKRVSRKRLERRDDGPEVGGGPSVLLTLAWSERCECTEGVDRVDSVDARGAAPFAPPFADGSETRLSTDGFVRIECGRDGAGELCAVEIADML
jgi:hypothetical protein